MPNLMNFTGTVLKNLFSKPVTKNYPAEPIDYPENSRGHIENDFEQCILCGLCMRNCPTGAIKVEKAEGNWRINRFDCIQCGYCTLKCPKKCLHIVPGYQEPGQEKVEEVQHRDAPAPAPKAEGGNAASGDGFPKADPEQCVYCSLCAKKCPQSAITVNRAEKRWELNQEACVKCGLCKDSCPKKCITM